MNSTDARALKAGVPLFISGDPPMPNNSREGTITVEVVEHDVLEALACAALAFHRHCTRANGKALLQALDQCDRVFNGLTPERYRNGGSVTMGISRHKSLHALYAALWNKRASIQARRN